MSSHPTGITFGTLIKKYSSLQAKVLSQIQRLASKLSTADPGQFLLAQFYMSQVTQVGDSISNMISQVNSVINRAVQNQKSQ